MTSGKCTPCHAALEAGRMLPECAVRALETMFFESASPLLEFPEGDSVSASVEFDGILCGRLWLAIEAGAARRLAASFLGLVADEAGSREAEMAACELANIICGSLLSDLECETGFELRPPALGVECEGAPMVGLSLDDGGWIEAGVVFLR